MVASNVKGTTDCPLILFDGVCNLCESSVRFVIQRDEKSLFRFASLQSTNAQKLLARYDHESDVLSSVLLIVDDKLYRKSRAGLQIAKRLDGAWPLLFYAFFWIPPFIADRIYDFVGNRRYQWFGIKDECWIPDDALLQRFVDDNGDEPG